MAKRTGIRESEKLANGSLQARYPDGNIALFEAFAQAPFSYVMTSYTNRKGRTIKYDYTQVDNLPYIRKILYGEAGSVYNDSIVFTYRNVTDDITRYVDGKHLNIVVYWKKWNLFIKVHCGGVICFLIKIEAWICRYNWIARQKAAN